MSSEFTTYYKPTIELLRKDASTDTPLYYSDDESDPKQYTYSLVKYRKSAHYTDTLNETAASGQIMLRNFGSRFTEENHGTSGNGVSDPHFDLASTKTKDNYLIRVRLQGLEGTVGRNFLFEITSGRASRSAAGRFITLTLTSLDVRLNEMLDSEILFLKTPKEAFNQRLLNYNKSALVTNKDSQEIRELRVRSGNIELIDDTRFRQDWIMSEPRYTRSLLSDIVTRLSQAESIAGTNEDWFFRIEYDWLEDQYTGGATNIPVFTVHAGLLGEEPPDPIQLKLSAVQHKRVKDIDRTIDNSRFKNLVIGIGAKGSHSLPMNFTRIASDLEHAKIAPMWDAVKSYEVGEYVRFTDNTSTTKSFKAKRTITPGSKPLLNKSTDDWLNLTPDIVEDDVSAFPWRDAEEWRKRLSGNPDKLKTGNTSIDGAIGFFHDMNIARRGYTLTNRDSDDTTRTNVDGGTIFAKDVISSEASAPATTPPKHGDRYLATSNWSGTDIKINDIAQWNSVDDKWDKSPDLIEGDLLHNRANATISRWTGRNWSTIWNFGSSSRISSPGYSKLENINKPYNVGMPSPFIPVKEIKDISDRDGIGNNAVRFTFDWNIFSTPQDVADAVLGVSNYLFPIVFGINQAIRVLGDVIDHIADSLPNLFSETNTPEHENTRKTSLNTVFNSGNAGGLKNRASRRYGWSIRLPWDRDNDPIHNDGFMDFTNLKGNWNDGIKSEDLGTLRGVRYWTRVSHIAPSGHIVTGISNIPLTHWFRDIEDRIVYVDATVRYHGAWAQIQFPAGPGSNMQQYDSRIDELLSFFGYTLPWDYFLRERELTGATFDWHHVIEMGCFSKLSYSDQFLYVGGQDAFFNVFTEWVTQATIKNPLRQVIGLDLETVVTDHVNLDISDLHFVKDAYVSSADEAIEKPRMKELNTSNQSDYINMKAMTKRYLSRQKFHPEYHIISCNGNPALKSGETILLGAPEDTEDVEGGNRLALISVKHVEDSRGYSCVLQAARRFTIVGNE